MLKSENIHGIFVLDQEQAKDFYINKLGLELKQDLDLGFMRWLTVGAPGDMHEILLELPGAPAMDEKTADTVRELVSKGATGFAAGFTTDDCQKTYDDLTAKAVEVIEPPVEHFYGKDFGLRDPFGNNLRIVEPATVWGDPTQDTTMADMVK